MNYPRINQYRHLFRAGRRVLLAVVLGGLGLLLAVLALGACYLLGTAGAYASAASALLILGGLAATLIFCGALIGRSAAGPLALAERNRVGAESEDYVTSILQMLVAKGWFLRSSVNWPGIGDIDNAMTSPGGEVAFAVETKTRTYLPEALQRVHEQASWLCRRHRCRYGAVPVLVPAREHGLERFQGGVLVVSPDRLIPALESAYGAACPTAG
jgi:hypothetical protein